MEKRLGAALISGDGIINIDNCDVALAGQLLCQCLTEDVVDVRPLGKSELIRVPNTACFYATGNNLIAIGDVVRRSLVGMLDPKCERPELRKFKTEDPIKIVKAARSKYVTAALTIVRAFIAAGMPRQTDPLGSFEAWSGLVRDALVWVDETDPCTTMERARADDPSLTALVEVLEQWHSAFATDEMTVKEVVDRATDILPQQNFGIDLNRAPRREFLLPRLREALLVVAGEGGNINSKRLGKWLGREKGRIVKGVRIVMGLRDRHWKIELVDG